MARHSRDGSTKVVVVGAGVGGLTTAALLAQAGLDVTVLEQHVYPGGCAGTFYHQKYRFDAGATLAGGYDEGGIMERIADAVGITEWPVQYDNPAMTIHMPDGTAINRWTDERRWDERRDKFGAEALPFWEWQERTADALWDFALKNPPWPPQNPADFAKLSAAGVNWLLADFPQHLRPGLLMDAFRPVSAHLKGLSERMRLFVDAQLLIASQAISTKTFAMYGAAALDLPRRGVVHLEGGIGAAAQVLAQAVENNGGRVLYRKEVTKVIKERGRPVAVEDKRGNIFDADILIFNLPPWNVGKIMGDDAPAKIKRLPKMPQRGGGAYMVYVGFDEAILPKDFPLHHQLIIREPMGEGNTLFFSLSPDWDSSRAPTGHRALTISTHTNLDDWWHLFETDREAYDTLKQQYTDDILKSAERVIPGLREAANLIKPGTPVTFRRFTKREWGWVGGFPQQNLFTSWGPRIDKDVWMVGDTIFPGQSVPAVALGGLRVAQMMLASMGSPQPDYTPTASRQGAAAK